MFLNIIASGMPGTAYEGRNKSFLIDLTRRTVRDTDLDDLNVEPTDFLFQGQLRLQKGGLISFPVVGGDKIYGYVAESIEKMADDLIYVGDKECYKCVTKSGSTYEIESDDGVISARGGAFSNPNNFDYGVGYLKSLPEMEEGKSMRMVTEAGQVVTTSPLVSVNKTLLPNYEVAPNPQTAISVDRFNEVTEKEE